MNKTLIIMALSICFIGFMTEVSAEIADNVGLFQSPIEKAAKMFFSIRPEKDQYVKTDTKKNETKTKTDDDLKHGIAS